MLPSEVRRTILEDHAALRIQLSDLRDMLHARGAGAAEVRELGASFRRRFLAHLELEDEYLVPALEQADAWGPERARRVAEEHTAQRARMHELLEHLQQESRPVEQLVEELESLIADLLVDMEHEERTVLQENLLRDDVISVDMNTG